MDETLRRHTLGCLGVYGDEPNLEIKGVFLFRGAVLPPPMIEHPQFEYFKRRQLDPKNEEDKKIFGVYLNSAEESQVEGLKC